jgi:hypothetical protein
MPYQSYAALGDSDAMALATYLKSLKPRNKARNYRRPGAAERALSRGRETGMSDTPALPAPKSKRSGQARPLHTKTRRPFTP